MTVCKALEPVVSVKQKVCLQIYQQCFYPKSSSHLVTHCYQLFFNAGRDLKSACKNTTSLWKSDRVSFQYRHGGSQKFG